MSFILSRSDDLYCAARSGFSGKGFINNRISIGGHDVTIDDFCALALYVFTNTDLSENDIRKEYVKRIGNLIEVDGFNKGNTRFEEVGKW